MKKIGLFSLLFTHQICIAQKWQEPLQAAVDKLCNDAAMQHGSFSFIVLDAANGKPVFEKNSDLGLPTASTQKVITAICANELLGNDYKYKTTFTLQKDVKSKKTNLLVDANFDPTLGSWRYANTSSNDITDTLCKLLKKQKVNQVQVVANKKNYLAGNAISDGWIYEDLGNYYGAGCEPLIWHENQYDIVFTQTPKANPVIKNTNPSWIADVLQIKNNITKGTANTGDNTCLYRNPFSNKVLAKGTIGAELDRLDASGSLEGGLYFSNNLNRAIAPINTNNSFTEGVTITKDATPIYTHYSPSLDSINYWFLRKSINIYGEALLRTMALKKYNTPDYEKGIQYIHTMCTKLGVDTDAVHIFDGCGLSPQNRITTKALATFMQYAHGKNYYTTFYNSLPIINDISMKSGSIHGARAYTGYISSSDNHVYTFAIAVNNYTGSGKDIQAKLWKILDVLK
jgi:serine-type D-Ala-D-Ala carboxypeptidase/endopeptidase (penicillin-binding protein 4)